MYLKFHRVEPGFGKSASVEFLLVLSAVKKKINHCRLISRELTDVVKIFQRPNCETWDVVQISSPLRPAMNYESDCPPDSHL